MSLTQEDLQNIRQLMQLMKEEIREEIAANNVELKKHVSESIAANNDVLKKYVSESIAVNNGELKKHVSESIAANNGDLFAMFTNILKDYPSRAEMQAEFDKCAKKEDLWELKDEVGKLRQDLNNFITFSEGFQRRTEQDILIVKGKLGMI